MRKLDRNRDGAIQISEAQRFDGSIRISSDKVDNISGLEHFTNMTGLNINANLRSLDLSPNEKLTKLTVWSCNNLTSLDFSKNRSLTELVLQNNDKLANLTLPNSNSLKKFNCYGSKISRFDISNHTRLESVNVSNNSLSSIDLSKNINLESLTITSNKISEIDVSKNKKLSYFICRDNQLQTLDLRHNTLLKTLKCGNNSIASLNLANNSNLTDLSCTGNEMTSLDLRNGNNKKLKGVDTRNNNLTKIEIDPNYIPRIQTGFIFFVTAWIVDDKTVFHSGGTQLFHITFFEDGSRNKVVTTDNRNVFRKGEKVKIEAFPANGQKFLVFYNELNSRNNPMELTINKNYSNQWVRFEECKNNEFNLEIDSENGQVQTSPSPNSKVFKGGTVVKLTAKPKTGYRFVRWEGDKNNSSNPTTIRMSKNSKIEAVYEKVSTAIEDIPVKTDIEISISPNPVVNMLSIQSLETIAQAELFNLMGNSLAIFHKDQFNMTGYPTGLYLLKVQLKNGTTKVVKFQLK
ncbi:T9SS type A sorting domain-containing protein [Halosquirtibacter xylanolyticus]|uniref:InlB B-repeat-containing protein n=1 Tax=Halosquirtibacter xylanolyticus TaxID=3374599 RepID=UPI00374A5A49|nr:T9SS type A sorting domain-containing protein [Prolixibacteraceae bacterium]